MIYKLANKILKENDTVAVETLDVKSMYQVHSIAKHLNKVTMGDSLSTLKYKADWLGKKVINIINIIQVARFAIDVNIKMKK